MKLFYYAWVAEWDGKTGKCNLIFRYNRSSYKMHLALKIAMIN